MKKQFVVALAILVSAFSFAQKKEVKALEKAVKSNDYAKAKTLVTQLKSQASSMDAKLKDRYYLSTAKAFYANGHGTSADVTQALEALSMVKGMQVDVSGLKKSMEGAILTRSNGFYQGGKFKEASTGFEQLYKLVPQDTTFLYYAASSSVSAKDYDTALKHYNTLKDIGYTGIEKQYYAINVDSGQEEVLDKNTRDIYVKAGSHVKPGERLTESKNAEIVKNIALIYITQGKNDDALKAIKDARKLNPDNVDLIINEANIYLQLKDDNKFKSTIEEALQKDPNNATLHYNVGVIKMKNGDLSARDSFKKALAINPGMADAVLNISTSYIDEGNALIQQMNALGTSAADNAKYDTLKAKKEGLFAEGAKVLEGYIGANPNAKNLGIYQQLQNIYRAIGEIAKAKALDAKITELGG